MPAFDDGAKLPEMVGAVIYVRVSTKEQTENVSLATQLPTCEEYGPSAATEIDSIEPPQRHHFSTTWRRPSALMKSW